MVNKFLKIRVYLVGMQTLLFLLFLNFNLCAQNINLKIHIKGVYTTKISLLPLSGANALKPFIEKQNVRNGQVITLLVPKDRLPGQFILRFDYQEKESSTPYPSERYFYINNQNLEFWVQPKAVNNPDSSYFQKGEKENALFVSFSKENGKRKEQLGLLQSFLMNYDQPQSKFYLNGIEEYENRRKKYNQWVSSQIDQHKDAFVSCTFPFQYVEPIVWKGTEQERMNSLIAHYFDDMDFKDPMLVKTADLKDWMNKYVNLYGAMSTTVALRDSLFTVAGKRAIEKASHGNPSVYGWMVDYFYAGYESFGIKNGMTMLQQYINDPNCLTSKKQQIIKRLDGMEKLVAGTLAPDFTLSYIDGSDFNFHIYKGTAKYKLLLFWSADCSHCDQLVTEMAKCTMKPVTTKNSILLL